MDAFSIYFSSDDGNLGIDSSDEHGSQQDTSDHRELNDYNIVNDSELFDKTRHGLKECY